MGSFVICKDLINERRIILRWGVVPHFSDLKVMPFHLTADYLGIDCENNLFSYPEIQFKIPYRLNMKNMLFAFKSFSRIGKRIEANFSQFCY